MEELLTYEKKGTKKMPRTLTDVKVVGYTYS